MIWTDQIFYTILFYIWLKRRSRSCEFFYIWIIFIFRQVNMPRETSALSEHQVWKLKQIMMRILVETEYLDDLQTEHLNPVLLGSLLKNVMQERQERALLTAFNCFI